MTVKQFVYHGAHTCMKNFDGYFELLKFAYPEIDWIPWRFQSVPRDYWSEPKHHRFYAEWLGKVLGYRKLEDWYQIAVDDFKNHSGDGLLVLHYNGSPIQFVSEMFPEKDWLPWLFPAVPGDHWGTPENQRKFLEWVLDQERLETVKSDIVLLTDRVIKQYKGGSSLLLTHKNTMDCIKSVFPEFSFEPSDFEQVGRGFWEDQDNQKAWLLNLGDKLGFRKPTDWYAIREQDFEEHGGISLINYYESSPAKVVLSLLPEHQLTRENFAHVSKLQARAFGIVSCLFPNKEVLFEFKHPGIVSPKTGRKLELDIFVPHRKLAIEIQGAQHYRPAWGGDEELKNIKQRDNFKRKYCKRLQIKLIEVRDDEWDGTVEQFLNIISQAVSIRINRKSFFDQLKQRGLLGSLRNEELFWNKKDRSNSSA